MARIGGKYSQFRAVDGERYIFEKKTNTSTNSKKAKYFEFVLVFGTR